MWYPEYHATQIHVKHSSPVSPRHGIPCMLPANWFSTLFPEFVLAGCIRQASVRVIIKLIDPTCLGVTIAIWEIMG